MTFGIGTNGCLGHGNYQDVSQVLSFLDFWLCFRIDNDKLISFTNGKISKSSQVMQFTQNTPDS